MGKNDKKRLFEVFEKVNKVSLKEWYDDEYFEKPQYPQGMGNFNDIDWRVLHEVFVDNDAVVKGISNNIGSNYGDLTDYDGMISPEELKQLEDFGLIVKKGAFPVIAPEYQDFDVFYNKAKEIWNQELPPDTNDSEAPYLRGREDSNLSM
jgi:hypothetical protein